MVTMRTTTTTTMILLMTASMMILLLLTNVAVVSGSDTAKSNPDQGGQGEGGKTVEDFVNIVKIPASIQSKRKTVVSYYCQTDTVIVLEILVMVFGADGYDTVFRKAWKCNGQGSQGNPRSRAFRPRLPHNLAYRPDFYNRRSDVIISARLRVAMVTDDKYKLAQKTRQSPFLRGSNQHTWNIPSLPPYRRPPLSPPCPQWYRPLVQAWATLDEGLVTCPKEADRITLLNYPAVFNGETQGVVRAVSAFEDPVLEMDRKAMHRRPRFTMEVWMYLIEYCPRHDLTLAQVCGVLVHAGPRNAFLTPAILINVHGQIQIDVQSARGFQGIKTMQVVPKYTWVRLVFSLDFRTWNLHVNYGPGLTDGFHVDYTYDEAIVHDDTKGFFYLGGLGDTLGSFVGYMGRAVLYRGRVLGPDQMTAPNPYHPMYELDLTSRDVKCQKFMSWLTTSVAVYADYNRYTRSLRNDSCPNAGPHALTPSTASTTTTTTCPSRHPPRERQYRYVSKLLRKAVGQGRLTSHHVTRELTTAAYVRRGGGGDSTPRRQEALHNVSKSVMDKAMKIMAHRGMKKARSVLLLLKQSACLGNDHAMFYLAAMLNNGVGVAADEIQSLAYSMLGTLNADSLSSMALGFRHSLGLDGAPRDLDVSYMYYKTVADKSRRDREEHKDSGYLPEKVRLIDEKLLSLQTNEVEDLFMWLKDQAAKGVESARTEMAELVYWGKQGVQRNLQTALNVYREGAEEGNVQSMYNYGLMQYRGIGGKVNKTEGAKMMKRAAEQKSPDAVNALGWMALEVDKNYTEAERLFRLAKSLRHPDAGYYLGHMYMQGHVPNAGVDYDLALSNLEWSARKNQIHAGNLYSFLLTRGTPNNPRNIDLAVQWARYIAEQNADLGQPLRTAVDSYRHGNLEESLYQYLVLAETGLEVASFNLAYLCELNTDGVTSFVTKDCVWRQYNLTVQREFKDVDSYSYIKMGDYYWYGCQKTRDLNRAAWFYAYAVLKKDPQALFNLAYMVEQGFQIPSGVRTLIGLNKKGLDSTDSILMDLYTRCSQSRKSEAYLPCTLALYRIQAVKTWKEWCQFFNVASLVGVIVSLVITLFLLYQWILIKIREIGLRRARRGVGRRMGRRGSFVSEEEDEEDSEVGTEGDNEGGRSDDDRKREREMDRRRVGGGVDDQGNELPSELRMRGEDRV